MVTSPFSIRLDPGLKERLERQAKREDRSAGYVVQQALEEYLDAQDYFHEEMAKAAAELDKGVFISGEAMHAWMESWGTEAELPPPEPDIFPKKDVA